MRVVVADRAGGPEVLRVEERQAALPGPHQLLVEVHASGVNYVDTYQRRGLLPVPTPFVPGVEGAGKVIQAGECAGGFAAGDRVAWAAGPGSYADQVLVDAEKTVPIPGEISDELAAAAMLQGMTAHYLTHSTYQIQPGDAALVHAAAGGMGLLLTQVIKLRGGMVIGTVSTEEKERLAREAGADEVVRYDGVDFAPEVRRLAGGAGVAVVYDGVGQSTFEGSLASLRPRGMLALFGAASGPVPPVDPLRLQEGSFFLTRPVLAHHVASRQELLWRAGDVLNWVAGGQVKVRVGKRYRLEDARAAHEDLESRRTTGKSLLIP
jgi:NADPH:quinone reductase